MDEVPKILIVDDEASVRLVLKRFLLAAAYEVIETSDGFDALEKLRSERPALVILDVDMPRFDGWNTLKELRGLGFDAPVLMLTNIDNVPARIKGLEAGADDYLGKPCDLTELLARVKALLRRSHASHLPLRLQFGELTVDLGRKTAARGHTPVRFTRTEYALLELLARHEGKPVSRESMLRQIWQMAEDRNSHTLDTCLWRLRKKIEEPRGEERWIRNLPGIGYVLECEREGSRQVWPTTASGR